MFDINFYMKFDEVVEEIKNGTLKNEKQIFDRLELIRSTNPVIYNIETTNRCNMLCKMCPRTTMMTRKIEDIERETFINIVDQMKPHTDQDWIRWKAYCKKKYGIEENEMSENHFFLYIIPKVVQLHGYGDPLLDNNIANYIKILKDRGLQSYFSCNPINIDLEKTYQMLDNGLDYIKYSIESVDDSVSANIRGNQSEFKRCYEDICRIIDYRNRQNLKSGIIITMLDLHRVDQESEFIRLKNEFESRNVYIYLKSENGQWYRQDYHPTKSIHWMGLCKHPWMSMTVKSNGEAAMCMEDFNNEIILGDVKKKSLYEIWNGDSYRKLRKEHIYGKFTNKCSKQCDMKLICDYVKQVGAEKEE